MRDSQATERRDTRLAGSISSRRHRGALSWLHLEASLTAPIAPRPQPHDPGFKAKAGILAEVNRTLGAMLPGDCAVFASPSSRCDLRAAARADSGAHDEGFDREHERIDLGISGIGCAGRDSRPGSMTEPRRFCTRVLAPTRRCTWETARRSRPGRSPRASASLARDPVATWLRASREPRSLGQVRRCMPSLATNTHRVASFPAVRNRKRTLAPTPSMPIAMGTRPVGFGNGAAKPPTTTTRGF